MVEEQNFVSGPVSGTISYFESTTNDDKRLYRFAAKDKPAGTSGNFELACPAQNAATIRFREDCPNEEGIAVYREAVNQPDNQFKFVASLPPDARTFSDGGVNPGQSFVYLFYLLSENQYADTYSEYTTEPIQAGVAFHAVTSGKWSNYHLKQVDFGGAFEYSSLVQLTLMGQQTSFSLYSTPATDKVRVRDVTYPAEAPVINLQGVAVWKTTLLPCRGLMSSCVSPI